MNILVVPTIRQNCIRDFLTHWNDIDGADWDHVIVVEDNPTKTFDIPEGAEHLCWEDIDSELGEDSWIISRRDTAIKCFGFLMAYKRGADFIFTLDDDCYPLPDSEGFCSSHLERMQNVPCWDTSLPGVRTRGLPYYNLGKLKNVVANMGFWHTTPDWDSIQTISGNTPEFSIPDQTRIVPNGQHFPLCGMNLCIRRDMAVCSYFPLMGLKSPYRRFDDIWFGIIFKRIADHLNYYVSVGPPSIDHLRASDPMTNLVKEAPGIKANEDFWEDINSVEFTGNTPKSCMQDIGRHLIRDRELAEGQDPDNYFSKLGHAILTWSDLFDEEPLSV